MDLPIVARFNPMVESNSLKQVQQIARQIIAECPELDPANCEFEEQMTTGPIEDACSLQIDDFSEIPIIGVKDNSHVLQQRARLRAVNGDYVVQSKNVERGFSDYCEYQLQLGRVRWLCPATPQSDPHEIALACWQDRRLRHDLEQAIRHEGLRYIHPHISTLQVWELAALLEGATRRPVKVIGPPPALAKWANDKIEFSAVANRLLGENAVPQTTAVYNYATLAKVVLRLAATHSRLGIKFPNGTGGNGNFLLKSENICGRSLKQIRNDLKNLLDAYHWPKGGRLLVDVWETDVINSPSVQMWIPPVGQGDPVVEGVFVQAVSGEQGNFVGSFPSELPAQIEQEMVNGSFLIASLFQQLGYVGRCSYDLILVGNSLDDCRIEFIECNARWGGTSAPMTLMNRLEIAKQGRTFGIQKIEVGELCQMEFAELKREIGDELYVPATGRGKFILFNPARIKENAAEVIAIGGSSEEVKQLLMQKLPLLLAQLVRRKSGMSEIPVDFLSGRADSMIEK